MSKKFDTIVESVMQRFQGTNFLVGDRVKFAENHTSHDWYRNLPEVALERLNAMIESGNNLRVTSVTANRPTGTLPVHAPNVTGMVVDIAMETAPGLFQNPFSVPCDLLVLQEDGINLAGDTPEGQVRKDNSDIKPKAVEEAGDEAELMKNQTRCDHPEKSNPTDNTKLDNASEPTSGDSYTKKYLEA